MNPQNSNIKRIGIEIRKEKGSGVLCRKDILYYLESICAKNAFEIRRVNLYNRLETPHPKNDAASRERSLLFVIWLSLRFLRRLFSNWSSPD